MSIPITIEEVVGAIKALKKDTCPGPDVFTSNLFEEILAPKLHQEYQYIFNDEMEVTRFNEAFLILIPKPDKDQTLCMSYRPISLINMEAKILASVLAKRIQSVLLVLVHPNQPGLITGRKGTDNIHTVTNLIGLYSEQTSKGIIMTLDAKKTFD